MLSSQINNNIQYRYACYKLSTDVPLATGSSKIPFNELISVSNKGISDLMIDNGDGSFTVKEACVVKLSVGGAFSGSSSAGYAITRIKVNQNYVPGVEFWLWYDTGLSGGHIGDFIIYLTKNDTFYIDIRKSTGTIDLNNNSYLNIEIMGGVE